MKKMISGSIFPPIKTDRLNSFEQKDIVFGPLLGEGSFCNILEITSLKSYQIISSVKHEERSLLEAHGNIEADAGSTREVTRQTRYSTGQTGRCYVAKIMRSDLCSSKQTKGAIDLTAEAKLLTLLSHRNIIKILGTSGEPGNDDYCLMLERLGKALPEKIKEWRLTKIRRYCHESIIETDASLWNERLSVISQIGDALNYLHSNKIIHRDIKPANILFNFQGVVKLIDFGFAKELKPLHRIGPDKYKSSKDIGTRRYMSPEVALSNAYGAPVDVFSFTILMWEVLTLKNAFYDIKSVDEHEQYAYVQKKRPIIPLFWSRKMKKLLVNGWTHNPSDRLPIIEINIIINRERSKIPAKRRWSLIFKC